MQVFVCNIDFEWKEHLYYKALERVDERKKEKIVRFVHKEDTYRSLLADLLLRTILNDQFHLKDEDMLFGWNEYGKPYLINRDNICFNLTHSGDWVGCVIGQKPVGIDIEYMKSIDLNIAKRFFSPDEYFALQRETQEKQLDFFYDLWTLKESYIKAVGKGMAIPLDSFTIRPEGDSALISGLDQEYYFKNYNFTEGYKMAVCSSNNCFPSKPMFVDALRLIQGELFVY